MAKLLPYALVRRVPFLRRRRESSWGSWDDDAAPIVPPPRYEKDDLRNDEGYYAQEKARTAVDSTATVSPIERPPQAFVNFSHRKPVGGGASNVAYSVASINTNVAPGFGLVRSGTINSTAAVGGDRSPTGTVDSNGVSVYSGNEGTVGSGTGTFRSRMPHEYFNQSELARQPSDAYDPARRQVNRASELSSLSSGFGDGDIIVPNQYMSGSQALQPQEQRQTRRLSGRFLSPFAQGSGNRTSVGRFSTSRFSSWFSPITGQKQQTPILSAEQQEQQQRRDTVYTEASEDSPPRFRSVNSWVNQQSGRVQRGQQQQQYDDDAPPVPALPGGQMGVPGVANAPPDQSFGLMMDDEVPRPVDVTGLARLLRLWA
jgi:hypothetical protein